jgi:uncharacterized integral membrane protein
MPIRMVLLLIVFAALAIFVVVNWTAFTTPTTLSLLAMSVEAPLGLIMLAITGALALVFLAYAFWLQTSVLLETRRMSRELEAQRQRADQAELSRFTELRQALDARFDHLDAIASTGGSDNVVALSRAGEDLRAHIDQAINGLSAQIAELDDRLGGRGGGLIGRSEAGPPRDG